MRSASYTRFNKSGKGISDKEEALGFIFSIDEKEVFTNELKNLEDEIKKCQLEHMKFFIIFNFILEKILQLDYHIDMTERLKIKSPQSEVLKYENIEKFNENKNYMIECLIKHLCENQSLIDMEEVKNILRSYNKDNMSQTPFNCEIINAIEKSINDTVYIKENNKGKNVSSNKRTEENIIEKVQMVEYNLSISYFYGSEAYPQKIKLNIMNNRDFRSFIHTLKKKLGIYENSKFRIILMENSQEKAFLKDIKQLKTNAVNELKIVPQDYEIP